MARGKPSSAGLPPGAVATGALPFPQVKFPQVQRPTATATTTFSPLETSEFGANVVVRSWQLIFASA
ncbi:MAG TPA: hypothetical protein VJQ26_03760 [Ktedonobacteraceae bacterium]|nr:hypothetical protein [Ktedonobacteraceae bacterium]